MRPSMKTGNQMSSWVHPLCPMGQNSLPRALQVSAVWGRCFFWCRSLSWESLAKWYLMTVISFNGHTRINKSVNLANLFHLEEISITEKNIIVCLQFLRNCHTDFRGHWISLHSYWWWYSWVFYFMTWLHHSRDPVISSWVFTWITPTQHITEKQHIHNRCEPAQAANRRMNTLQSSFQSRRMKLCLLQEKGRKEKPLNWSKSSHILFYL